MGFLGAFDGPSANSNVLLASGEASWEDIAVLYISNFTDSMTSTIDLSPASIIIGWSTPSLSSSSCSLSNSILVPLFFLLFHLLPSLPFLFSF